MIYPVYSIRDYKGDFFSPRIAQNDQTMIREFAMMVNDTDSVIAFCPRDFGLYQIGEFDSMSGLIKSIEAVKCLINGDELVGAK